MANVDQAFGFRAVQDIGGAPYNGPLVTYEVAATYGTALYIGYPVVVTGGGSVEGIPQIAVAVTGSSNTVSAVIEAFEPLPSSLETKYWAASTATRRKAYCVQVTANTVFEVQEDSEGGALDKDACGLNAAWSNAGGSTVTGIATIELDSSTADTTNTRSLRILRLSPRVGNSIGTNAVWLVKFNFPQDNAVLGI
jgi:hypothetical protein